jgi:hypothetical protein
VGYGFRLIVPDSNTTASSFKISVVGAGLRCSLFFIYKHPLRLPSCSTTAITRTPLAPREQQHYPQVLTKIRFQLAPSPTKAEKAAQGKAGFVPVATRWIIERSNAWMERCKSLVKNFERTLSHATAKLNLCFIRLMLKRLANG